jgi:Rieske 2Fe-2S family protein
MEIMAPHESATMSGRACGALVNPSLPESDRRRAYYYSIMPNLLLSVHPDYVNFYLIVPESAERTTVESAWLFSAANEGREAFNPGDAIEFWDTTNRQDWNIVEQSQLGIASTRYSPGPYSPRESIPAEWDRFYRSLMG